MLIKQLPHLLIMELLLLMEQLQLQLLHLFLVLHLHWDMDWPMQMPHGWRGSIMEATHL